jgi:hypothetical protein
MPEGKNLHRKGAKSAKHGASQGNGWTCFQAMPWQNLTPSAHYLIISSPE